MLEDILLSAWFEGLYFLFVGIGTRFLPENLGIHGPVFNLYFRHKSVIQRLKTKVEVDE